MTLVVLSMVLPGLGHLAGGRRTAGLLIVGTALALLAAVMGVALAVAAWPETVATRAAGCALSPTCLGGVRVGVLAAGAGWIAVILSAVALGHPGAVSRPRRLIAFAVAAVLCAAVAGPTLVLSNAAGATQSAAETLFGRFAEDVPATAGAPAVSAERAFADGRVNVLLLGADSGAGRQGLRTDTVIVASLDVATGRAILFSLPRNLQDVPFPPGSAMARAWPEGFDCGDACLLNAVYQEGVDHPERFPGEFDPGTAAVRAGVSQSLGLSLDYTVLVTLEGFETVIDALGGVRITVAERLPIGGLDADGNRVKPSGYIQAGPQRMDGATALAYVRSRSAGTDYDRVERQSCLLGAVTRQVDLRTVLTRYGDILGATSDAVRTDITRSAARALLELAVKVRGQPIERLAFIPPTIENTTTPDFVRIRSLVRTAIADSGSVLAATRSPTQAVTRMATPTPGATPTAGATGPAAPSPTRWSSPVASPGTVNPARTC
jgi:LCP family protein required for cell wall assembly